MPVGVTFRPGRVSPGRQCPPERVAGEFRLRSGEFKTARLANNAAASIATHEPFRFEKMIAGLNRHPILGLLKVSNCEPALDFDTQGFCAASEHRFKLLHFRNQIGVGRAWQAISPLRGINIAFKKWNAGEVPYLTAWPLCVEFCGGF